MSLHKSTRGGGTSVQGPRGRGLFRRSLRGKKKHTTRGDRKRAERNSGSEGGRATITYRSRSKPTSYLRLSQRPVQGAIDRKKRCPKKDVSEGSLTFQNFSPEIAERCEGGEGEAIAAAFAPQGGEKRRNEGNGTLEDRSFTTHVTKDYGGDWGRRTRNERSIDEKKIGLIHHSIVGTCKRGGVTSHKKVG